MSLRKSDALLSLRKSDALRPVFHPPRGRVGGGGETPSEKPGGTLTRTTKDIVFWSLGSAR